MLPPLRGVELESEFWFHPDRKWRFDFAIAPFKIAIEIDGRARGKRCPTCKADSTGRHQTVDGVRRDLEKDRAAVLRGWHILRYPATDKANALAWAREVRELLGMIDPVLDQCAVCDCTELDCSQCVARTGEPCYWARAGVCSACAERMGKPRR
jgi:very-short-patch-repair endonuclease